MKVVLGIIATVLGGWLAYHGVQTGQPIAYLQASLFLVVGATTLPVRGSIVAAGLVILIAILAAVGRAGSLSLNLEEWQIIATAWFSPLLATAVLRATWHRGYSIRVSTILLFVMVTTLSVGALRNALPPVNNRSTYVEMDDGIRLALDFRLPRDYDGATRPTVVTFSRYFRSTRLNFPFNLLFSTESGNSRRLVKAGYAVVVVDVRGAGASFGSRPQEFSRREVDDYVRIVDWIVAQPWSNGVVGTEGVSYGGTAAELLMLKGHPAVKAIASQYALFDAYDDAAFPGGLENAHITRAWGQMLRALDRNDPPPGLPLLGKLAWRGVRPVDGPDGEALLAAALAEHEHSFDPAEALGQVEFRDDLVNGRDPFDGSPSHFLEALRSNTIPVLYISGWFDGAYQAGALKKFLNSDNPDKYGVIGPWDHGPATSIDPCGYRDDARRGNRSSFTLPFYDYYLRGIDNDFEETPSIRYYTMCGGGWRGTDNWPPNNSRKRFYLRDDGLAPDAPPDSQSIAYQVDPRATSGPSSRWAALVRVPGAGLPTAYTNRVDQSPHLLVFLGPRLDEDLEVAGYPVVELFLESSRPDGALVVYLEDVGPNGQVRYVTEGQLRLGSRDLEAEPMHEDFVPARSNLRSDFRPMIPGEIERITVGLLPTAYRFKAGHRVRIAIAGVDKDNFRPLENELPKYRVHSGPDQASFLELPIERRMPLHWTRPD